MEIWEQTFIQIKLTDSCGVVSKMNLIWMLQWARNSFWDDMTGLEPTAGQWQDALGEISEPSVPMSKSMTIPHGK